MPDLPTEEQTTSMEYRQNAENYSRLLTLKYALLAERNLGDLREYCKICFPNWLERLYEHTKVRENQSSRITNLNTVSVETRNHLIPIFLQDMEVLCDLPVRVMNLVRSGRISIDTAYHYFRKLESVEQQMLDKLCDTIGSDSARDLDSLDYILQRAQRWANSRGEYPLLTFEGIGILHAYYPFGYSIEKMKLIEKKLRDKYHDMDKQTDGMTSVEYNRYLSENRDGINRFREIVDWEHSVTTDLKIIQREVNISEYIGSLQPSPNLEPLTWVKKVGEDDWKPWGEIKPINAEMPHGPYPKPIAWLSTPRTDDPIVYRSIHLIAGDTVEFKTEDDSEDEEIPF